MHLGAVSVMFINKPVKDAAKRMRALGLDAIEIVAGGFFPKGHCHPTELLADKTKLTEFQETLATSGLKVSALALHGEPLSPDAAVAKAYGRELRDTCALAEKIGVTRVTLLAGLPEAVPGDKASNWILFPFPPSKLEQLKYQWDKRLVPYWKEHARIADDHGVQLCFEMAPGDLVYNPETMLRLRSEVGRKNVGCNFDPSHLFFQGIEVPEALQALREVIFHVHAKDAGFNDRQARVNGLLDPKTFKDVQGRAWIYRTVGYGHDEAFWRKFVSTLRMLGYDDVLSIEHEDLLIDPEEGFELAVGVLQKVILRKPVGEQWFE